MLLDWTIVKRAAAQRREALQAVYAYLIVREEYAFGFTRQEAAQLFQQKGFSRSYGYKLVSLLLKPVFGVPLAHITDGVIQLIGTFTYLKQQSLEALGDVTFTDEDLVSFDSFKRAAYENVFMAIGRDPKGGKTVSVRGLGKLVQRSDSTVRRLLRSFDGLVIRHNAYFDEATAYQDGLPKERGRNRLRFGRFVQIRNTYYSKRPAAFSEVAPCFVTRGTSVAKVDYLVPEEREKYKRATAWVGIDMPELNHIDDQPIQVDVELNDMVHNKTGELWGRYRRTRSTKELKSVLTQAAMGYTEYVYDPHLERDRRHRRVPYYKKGSNCKSPVLDEQFDLYDDRTAERARAAWTIGRYPDTRPIDDLVLRMKGRPDAKSFYSTYKAS